MVRHEVRGSRRFEPHGEMHLSAVLDFLAPSFRSSVHAAVDRYDQMGVRYALIGGVAAGAYGTPRATRDIDFLVGDEAFDVTGDIISLKPGLPVETTFGVPIDSIPPPVEYRDLYERALNEAVESDEPGVRIASAAFVAATKLAGGRLHDMTAVIEMVDAGTVDLGELERLVEPYPRLRVRYARMLELRQ